MPRIIVQHKANLLLQILLKLNVHVTCVWSLSVLLLLIICWRNIGLAVVTAYIMIISIEFFRLRVGYDINLIRRKAMPARLLWIMLALSLPFMWSLWHLRTFVVHQQKHVFWLQTISNAWLVIVVLEVLVALYEHCTK